MEAEEALSFPSQHQEDTSGSPSGLAAASPRTAAAAAPEPPATQKEEQQEEQQEEQEEQQQTAAPAAGPSAPEELATSSTMQAAAAAADATASPAAAAAPPPQQLQGQAKQQEQQGSGAGSSASDDALLLEGASPALQALVRRLREALAERECQIERKAEEAAQMAEVTAALQRRNEELAQGKDGEAVADLQRWAGRGRMGEDRLSLPCQHPEGWGVGRAVPHWLCPSLSRPESHLGPWCLIRLPSVCLPCYLAWALVQGV